MKPQHSNAGSFALQLGALIGLYASLGALTSVIIGIIDLAYAAPDISEWYAESLEGSITFGISVLLVAFPTYLILTSLVNRQRRASGVQYIGLTKWLMYLSLVGITLLLLIDVVVAINTFLSGEATTDFFLKVLTIAFALGLALFYYVEDARNYWLEHQNTARFFGVFAAGFVMIVMAFGFAYTGLPQKAYQRNLDEQQRNDFRQMSRDIRDLYDRANEVPKELPSGIMLDAPEGRSAYEYYKLSSDSYQLCGYFALDSRDSLSLPYKAGRWCYVNESAGKPTRW